MVYSSDNCSAMARKAVIENFIITLLVFVKKSIQNLKCSVAPSDSKASDQWQAHAESARPKPRKSKRTQNQALFVKKVTEQQ